MSKTYFDTNAFMNFLFAFLILIISSILLLMPPDNFGDLALEFCQCALGISSLATIYTGWQLYKSKIKV